MKPAPFRYHAPATVEEALELLAVCGDAKILAGGQSLMPLMNLRLTGFEDLIDIGRIDGLASIAIIEDALSIGATTRQRACERSTGVKEVAPILPEALAHVGHPQTRNRGTVGGSLAHLDPAAELVAVASAMDAVIDVASRTGRRSVSIHDFAHMAFTSDLEPDELLISVDLPLWRPGHGYAFEEFARRHGDFAIVAVAALVDLDGDGRISRAAVALVGMDVSVVRARDVEQMLLGEVPSDDVLQSAANAVREHAATRDIHGPPEYRQHLGAVLTKRALRRATNRVERPSDG